MQQNSTVPTTDTLRLLSSEELRSLCGAIERLSVERGNSAVMYGDSQDGTGKPAKDDHLATFLPKAQVRDGENGRFSVGDVAAFRGRRMRQCFGEIVQFRDGTVSVRCFGVKGLSYKLLSKCVG